MEMKEWKEMIDKEVKTIDRIIKVLTQLRDATALSTYPDDLSNYGLRKRQPSEHRDFVVSMEYQIRFWREGDDWVCRWTDREMEFHQKMMNSVVEYAQDK